MIRSLVFDFDGLLIDTESVEFGALSDLFREHGSELKFEIWADCVGRPAGWFDPYMHLSELLGRPIDREAARERFRRRHRELAGEMPLLPGAAGLVHAAKGMGLGLAVASSSPHSWVDGHLERVGLLSVFDAVVCAEDTERHKPDPAPYLAACARLGVAPGEAVAFEDSPNGIAAAKAAGLRCVAVPNLITRRLPMDGADLRLDSLADLSLTGLLDRLED